MIRLIRSFPRTVHVYGGRVLCVSILQVGRSFHSAVPPRFQANAIFAESGWSESVRKLLGGASRAKTAAESNVSPPPPPPPPAVLKPADSPAEAPSGKSVLSRMAEVVSNSAASSAKLVTSASSSASTAVQSATDAARSAVSASAKIASGAGAAARDAAAGASSAAADSARRAAEYARKGASEAVPSLVRLGTSAAKDYAKQKVRRIILFAVAFAALIAFAYGAGRSLPHALAGLVRGEGAGEKDKKEKG